MTLYHVSWCPECAAVREKLAELGLNYESVVVPDVRPMRKQVYEVSGQYYVPVLQDDETVLTETREILKYLDTRHTGGERPEGGGEGEDVPSCPL